MIRRAQATQDAVIVPAIGAGSSIAAIRSLKRQGVHTIGLSTNGPQAVFKSRYLDEAHVAPSPSRDLAGYEAKLRSLAERPDVVTVVPLQEADIYVLSKHREAFAECIATPWPEFDTVRATQDWLQLLEAADGVNVPTPETRPLDQWDHWDQPAVIKSRYSIIEDEGRLFTPGMRFVKPGATVDVDTVIGEMGHVPIVQEYVPGDAEHGFFALFDHGSPIAMFQHRRIRSYTYSGGASVYRKSIAIPELEEVGIAMLRKFDWHGPAMVEFKRDPRDGSFRLMEINPRFWGSLPLAVHAGVDFPALYYQLVTGKPLSTTNYEVGLGCHLLRGEVSYLHSVLRYDHELVDRPQLRRELPAVLASVVRQPHFDFLSLQDPIPFVADVIGAAADAFPSPPIRDWIGRTKQRVESGGN